MGIAKKRHLLLGTAAFALCAVADMASAQEMHGVQSAQPSTGASAEYSDIVVTARRRDEKLQDVPVAVQAFNSEALAELRISSEADLQTVSAGLTVRQTTSSNDLNFTLRGQSRDAISFSAPAVVPYFNEFGVQGYSAAALFDLSSIQVLKGPQGTLFGRNATGGAVLYATERPSTEGIAGYARAGYGNYDDRLLEGAVNLPLSNFAAVRAAAQWEKRDGFQRNLYLGTKNGSIDNFTGRISVLLKPAEGIENITVLQYGRYGGVSTGPKTGSIYLPGQTNNGVAVNPAIPSGAAYANGADPTANPRVAQLGFTGIQDYFSKLGNFGFYDIFNNQTGAHRARQRLGVNTTTIELGDDLTFKNILGYNRVYSKDQTDVDASPYEPLTIGFLPGVNANGYKYLNRQISDELQLSGTMDDGRLNFIVGAFYFSGLATHYDAVNILSDAPAPFGPGPVFLRYFESKNISKAMYAQATYKLTDRLNITVGGRYTWETIKYRGLADDTGDSNQVDLELLLGTPPARDKQSKPSWNVTLDYKVSDSLMVYAAQRGSWRTGGFNGTGSDVVNGVRSIDSFKPETTYDFEVGTKFDGHVGGVPLRLNAALYEQHVKNAIRVIYTGVSAVSGNVNKVRVRGFELDGSIRPAKWLEIGGTFALTSGKFTDPIASVGQQTFTFGPYADTPKRSGSLYARVEHELADGSSIVLRGDLYAQSSFYYSNAADTVLPDTKLPGYALVNTRIEWNEIAGTGVSLAAYAKNLAQEKYYTGGFALGGVVGINGILTGVPRTYGVEAKVKF